MAKINYDRNVCVVKISVTSETDPFHVSDVVYYRSGMSPDFVLRWYRHFEYLAALVKVHNPKRSVFLYRGPQECLLGKEWHEHRRAALLKSRTIKLKQLKRVEIDEDLFGFNRADHERHIKKIELQIKMLERDEYPIPDFPEYINKIKRLLK